MYGAVTKTCLRSLLTRNCNSGQVDDGLERYYMTGRMCRFNDAEVWAQRQYSSEEAGGPIRLWTLVLDNHSASSASKGKELWHGSDDHNLNVLVGICQVFPDEAGIVLPLCAVTVKSKNSGFVMKRVELMIDVVYEET